MRPLYLFLLFISSISLSAQTVKGIIYNATSTIEDIKIVNLTSKETVLSNNKGEFTIDAKINDTLEISAIFYIKQQLVVKSIHEKERSVIQLKKAKNTLDEVFIKSLEQEKVADIKKLNVTIRNQILEDIKNNPHLYGKTPNGNIDFIKIIGLIGKLFKSKVEPFKPIIYEDIVNLFSAKHKLFNDDLLFNTLNIKKDRKFLFFEWIDTKGLNSKLLAPSKQLELLDYTIKIGNEFNAIILNYEKEKKTH